MMPGGLSADAYLARRLRPLDAEHFSGAGLLPYRVTSDGVEVLLPKERPWNSCTQAYDPMAWNVFGGKRLPRQERRIEVTATRSFIEAVMCIDDLPSTDELHKVIVTDSFVVWYPLGKFALIGVDVTNEGYDDMPEKYLAGKPRDGHQEFFINEQGIKKWLKNIETLEWLSAASLVSEPEGELSDLMQNFLKVRHFTEFLTGNFDPKEFPPEPTPEPSMPKRRYGGGGGGGGGGKGYKAYGKGGVPMVMDNWQGGAGYGGCSSFGGCVGGGGGFNAMSYGSPMPQVNSHILVSQRAGCGGCLPYFGSIPQTVPMPDMQQQMQANVYYQPPTAVHDSPGPPPPPAASSEETRRQIYGEQIYVMVQPLSPSPYLAQKITGMLLELPENELVLNLSDADELKRRVNEAIEVLREDGIIK
eukprot:TRINITY_DN5889_c1_g1_i2.p1 TRINITY_DN5889_c1_g1~~TRINITY_DN5889_c1_g1_i2.p1  ORF type:complete len:452 (-),score=105.47 TRINITY_DN5889_c1_g1_i2:81-1328(-)